MFTPDGHSARKIEKVMLLALWANALKEEKEFTKSDKKMIMAGLGRPTYPINQYTINSYLSYWQDLDALSKKWREHPETMMENAAIDYGDPRGDKISRAIMAEAMSRWYQTDIKAENIIFTVGGIGGLRAIFDTFNTHFEDIPGYRIITPFPHYSVYSNNPSHQLYPIDLMDKPGYKLTGRALKESIEEAYNLAETDKGFPKAVLICNPSNPLGNIIDEIELIKIAEVLRCYSDLYIIFDEAYAEMSFRMMPSFLKIAPDLKKRTLILRSATKALSAAGERMAILLAFDEEILNELLNKNINYFIHAPRSAQKAYSETMANFDSVEQKKLITYYEEKVNYVLQRLQKMGAYMPDPNYHVEATFYVLADFSDLFGLSLPEESARVFQKIGIVSTSEQIAYYLLFVDSVMIAPLSYFGLSENSGFIRITCSANQEELKELMDRLENRLIKARINKKLLLIENINHRLPQLSSLDKHNYKIISKNMALFSLETDDCLTLKNQINSLEKVKLLMIDFLNLNEKN